MNEKSVDLWRRVCSLSRLCVCVGRGKFVPRPDGTVRKWGQGEEGRVCTAGQKHVQRFQFTISAVDHY